MYKNKWLMLLVNLLFIFLMFFIFAPKYDFLHFINAFFYIFAIYAIIYLFLFTVKGGFFDGIVFGFRRFNNKMFNKEDYLEEWKDKPLPSESLSMTFYQWLKSQTLLLLLLLLILLVLFYTI
ncbi:DUF3899 domain-containing protein [Caldibacillus lycopersici]|uniref:DUF3899 domain-containing protein n=1 Tax=Perspicuibacillus lycopersici TaxID=1325689 RepID=A0AAE3IV24_9BACI|nr:DUF3899 domain-containing protein [Perspicuibacillus lycopersici]MCU9613409.1 DUF3899 domain-containing protein [Perspicuibacillus lycopersici]